MKITLSQLCDNIAKKVSVEAKDLRVLAWYPLEEYMSKHEENARGFLNNEYTQLSEKDRLMCLSIYYRDLPLLEMDVQGVSPNDNDLYKILDIGFNSDCVGPGFYYWKPYFKIDGRDIKDEAGRRKYAKFLKTAEYESDDIEFFDSNLRGLTKSVAVKTEQESEC